MENAGSQVMLRQPQSMEMTPADVRKQVNLIQQVMAEAMKDGEHYGTIPGCGDKPALLKAGAEKLSLTFRLAPSYEIKEKELPGNHREYVIVCTITNMVSGVVHGQGVGSCSTMESKFRYRTLSVDTGKTVPKEYWDNRDEKHIGGPGHSVKKVDGAWHIMKRGEKGENEDPADCYNTVLKMAKKRAYVDAMLTATAASDIFTQDIEEMIPEAVAVKTEPKLSEPAKTHQSPPAQSMAPSEPLKPIEPKQQKTLPVPEFVKDAKDEVSEVVKILSVEQKSGSTKGKEWTRYGIKVESCVEGEMYLGTFDSDLGENASKRTGNMAAVIYTIKGKYKTLQTISDAPDGYNAPISEPSPWDNEGVNNG